MKRKNIAQPPRLWQNTWLDEPRREAFLLRRYSIPFNCPVFASQASFYYIGTGTPTRAVWGQFLAIGIATRDALARGFVALQVVFHSTWPCGWRRACATLNDNARIFFLREVFSRLAEFFYIPLYLNNAGKHVALNSHPSWFKAERNVVYWDILALFERSDEHCKAPQVIQNTTNGRLPCHGNKAWRRRSSNPVVRKNIEVRAGRLTLPANLVVFSAFLIGSVFE